VLHRALANRTGKLRVSDAYLICGIEDPHDSKQARCPRNRDQLPLVPRVGRHATT
jgi:hypothetical protein